MKTDYTFLYDRIAELQAVLDQIERAGLVDDGSRIRISHNTNGGVRYFLRTRSKDKQGVYLPVSEMDKIQGIVQQNYDLKVEKAARSELNYLERFIDHYPSKLLEDIYPSLHPDRRALISPAILPIDEFVEQWLAVKWDPVPFRPEDDSEYYNKQGVRMKSKQETILSNYFIDRDVPQRYEFPVRLKGIGEVHPDFMLLNKRTRKEFYWEHFGLWDNPAYMKKAVRKIVAYQRTGIYLGEQLIVTFETSNYHPGLYDINQLIDHYLV